MKLLWDLFVYACICFLLTCLALAIISPRENTPNTLFKFTPLYIEILPMQTDETIPLPREFQKDKPSEERLVNFLICTHSPRCISGVFLFYKK